MDFGHLLSRHIRTFQRFTNRNAPKLRGCHVAEDTSKASHRSSHGAGDDALSFVHRDSSPVLSPILTADIGNKLGSLYQPLCNCRRKIALHLTAHVHADVSDGKGTRRNQMVLLGIDIQHWYPDRAEVHRLSPDFHFTFDQLVSLIEIFHELTVRFSRLIRTIKDPFFHS